MERHRPAAITALVGTPLSMAVVAAPPRNECGVTDVGRSQAVKMRRSSFLTLSAVIDLCREADPLPRGGKRKLVSAGIRVIQDARLSTGQKAVPVLAT